MRIVINNYLIVRAICSLLVHLHFSTCNCFFIVMIEWRDIKLNQFIKININDDGNNCEEEEDDIQYNTYTKYTCI